MSFVNSASDTLQLKPFGAQDIGPVSDLFCKELKGAFSSALGEKFLKELYFPYFLKQNAYKAQVVSCDSKLVGFILGGPSTGFYEGLIKKHGFAFLGYALKAVFRDPALFMYCLRMTFVISSDPLPAKQPVAEILYMAVDSKHQGQGLGSRLVENLEQQLKANGFASMIVQTLIETPQAKRFYQKNAYRPCQEKLGRTWLVKELD